MKPAARLYAALLRLYPRPFCAEFGEEMAAVFAEAMNEAAGRGRLASYLLRELRDVPQALAAAHWIGWVKKWHEFIKLIGEVVPVDDLPPAPPDGRASWRQAGLELSLFLLSGLGLILVTYLPIAWPEAGWEHNLDLLGKAIVPVTFPIFLIGLARGLPRWAYPYSGLLLSYSVLSASQTGLLAYLVAMLLACGLLVGLTLKVYGPLSPLPLSLRRIAQSLSLDWTRLSFGIYGALPLTIIAAFDDAHFNNRTPYLALAAIMMVVSALIYCRSRRGSQQIAALLGGMSISIWAAWLDEAYFAASLQNWIEAQRPTAVEITWILNLWLPWVALLLVPALLFAVTRTGRPKRGFARS
jgi:hypothetical protein